MKSCKKCNETKDLSKFYKDKSFKDGLRSTCKSCDNIKSKRNYRKYDIKVRYGISLDEYKEMSLKQNNCCAICQKPQNKLRYMLCVDHNHGNGQIRELLCKPCNLIIGNCFENTDILKKTISYLVKHAQNK